MEPAQATKPAEVESTAKVENGDSSPDLGHVEEKTSEDVEQKTDFMEQQLEESDSQSEPPEGQLADQDEAKMEQDLSRGLCW